MLKELLGKDREIMLMASAELLSSLNECPRHDDNALLIYYSLEDKEYDTTSCKDSDIIPETLGSEDYAHRQYTVVNLSKDEETKLLILTDIGIDIKEAVVSFIKEEDIKWFNYEECYYEWGQGI